MPAMIGLRLTAPHHAPLDGIELGEQRGEGRRAGVPTDGDLGPAHILNNKSIEGIVRGVGERGQLDLSDNLVTYHCGAPVALRNGAQAEAGPRLGGGPAVAPRVGFDLLRNLSTASVRPTMEFSRLST